MYISQPSRYVPIAVVAALAVCGRAPAFAQDAEGRAPAVRHHLVWRDDCLMCHRPGAIDVVPDAPGSHRGRPSETCLWCHAEGAAMRERPPVVPHEIRQRAQCLLCHTAGRIAAAPDMPAYHVGITDESCVQCHVRTPSKRP
jgi:hypothetical protein